MKIEEMYPYYQMRHENATKELKRRLDEVVTSFREAADRIPEDPIYQAIAFHESNDESSTMEFYVENNSVEYLLGDEITGKVEMDDVLSLVNQFEDFINSEYKCNVYLWRFEWDVVDNAVNLVFISHITEEEVNSLGQDKTNEERCYGLLQRKASCFVFDLREVLSEEDVETDDEGMGADAQLVITLYI